jgi:hypothetical protein
MHIQTSNAWNVTAQACLNMEQRTGHISSYLLVCIVSVCSCQGLRVCLHVCVAENKTTTHGTHRGLSVCLRVGLKGWACVCVGWSCVCVFLSRPERVSACSCQGHGHDHGHGLFILATYHKGKCHGHGHSWACNLDSAVDRTDQRLTCRAMRSMRFMPRRGGLKIRIERPSMIKYRRCHVSVESFYRLCKPLCNVFVTS